MSSIPKTCRRASAKRLESGVCSRRGKAGRGRERRRRTEAETFCSTSTDCVRPRAGGWVWRRRGRAPSAKYFWWVRFFTSFCVTCLRLLWRWKSIRAFLRGALLERCVNVCLRQHGRLQNYHCKIVLLIGKSMSDSAPHYSAEQNCWRFLVVVVVILGSSCKHEAING